VGRGFSSALAAVAAGHIHVPGVTLEKVIFHELWVVRTMGN
jgi:hypothetical protein